MGDGPKPLNMKAWVEDYNDRWEVPDKCPECGSRLMKTDALGLINILWVGCVNRECRWCELYEEPKT